MTDKSRLEWALDYVARGWPVLPLYPVINGKCQCPDRIYKSGPDPAKWKCSPGKHPYVNLKRGVKDATLDPDRIRLWWGPRMWPDANIGIGLAGAHLLDVAPDGVDDLGDFIARGLPETLSFRSGGGEGHQHFLYQLPLDAPIARLCLSGHYDIMSDGYAVVPPSTHASGGEYVWVVYSAAPGAIPPSWPLELLTLQIEGRTPATEVSVPGDAVLGLNGEPPLDIDRQVWAGQGAKERSGSLWAIAGELAQAGANEATIVEALRERDDALWGKYTNRKDKEKRYVEAARRQLAAVMPRIHLGSSNGTATPPDPAPSPSPSVAPWPEPLADAAFYGALGEFVLEAARQSEADPAALMGMALSGISAAFYPTTAAHAGDAYHAIRLNAVLVGPTSTGRKGSASKVIENLIRTADSTFNAHIVEGLSSGEGLIWQIRDAIYKFDRKTQTPVIDDPGIAEKRLWVVETEFGMTLRVLQRDGNTLSGIVRRAWDLHHRAVLGSLVKNSPARSTGAHIVIASHVTREELLRYVDRTDLVNGFANRFLWFASRQTQELPFGERINPDLTARFADVVHWASEWTRDEHTMSWASETRAAWAEAYHGFTSKPRGGLYGSVTARAAPQVLRMSSFFAALERTNQISLKHLEAALAIWEHVDHTCQWIFGSILGDQYADDILLGLRTVGPLTRNDIRNYLGHHVSAAHIDRALDLLRDAGLTSVRKVPTAGRAAEVWSLA